MNHREQSTTLLPLPHLIEQTMLDHHLSKCHIIYLSLAKTIIFWQILKFP